MWRSVPNRSACRLAGRPGPHVRTAGPGQGAGLRSKPWRAVRSRCGPTGSGWSRCSRTCCPTPSSSPRRASRRWRCAAMETTGSRLPSPIPASASPPTSNAASSRRSGRPTAPTNRKFGGTGLGPFDLARTCPAARRRVPSGERRRAGQHLHRHLAGRLRRGPGRLAASCDADSPAASAPAPGQRRPSRPSRTRTSRRRADARSTALRTTASGFGRTGAHAADHRG